MSSPRSRRLVAVPAALATLVGTVLLATPASATSHAHAHAPDRLFVNVAGTAGGAAAGLTGQARADALTIAGQPYGTWITTADATKAAADARAVVKAAAKDRSEPLLVLYNIPFRDCAQYSAGGATSTAEYEAWVDAIAKAIGNEKAIVALEPDSLGIIPFNTDINGNAEWCQPADADPATAVSDRYAQLTHAVKALKAHKNTKVYLDGTHSGWLGVGDITDRLIKADVAQADGFFLNASNYESQFRITSYSRWISQCLDLSTRVSGYQPSSCASQYYPADPSKESTWHLTDEKYAADYAAAGIAPDPKHMKRSIIDTSRNGQGSWTPPADNGWPDAQTWCNPPDRGLGVLPTLSTGDRLIDGFVWIKVPGESDGQCDRGTGTGVDPARGGTADPAAGAWFATMARELVANAAQPVPAPTCRVRVATTRLHGAFVSTVTVTNTGSRPVTGWKLQYAFDGTQRITLFRGGAAITQQGQFVTARGVGHGDTIRPGRSATFGYVGLGTTPTTALYLLNGKTCAA